VPEEPEPARRVVRGPGCEVKSAPAKLSAAHTCPIHLCWRLVRVTDRMPLWGPFSPWRAVLRTAAPAAAICALRRPGACPGDPTAPHLSSKPHRAPKVLSSSGHFPFTLTPKQGWAPTDERRPREPRTPCRRRVKQSAPPPASERNGARAALTGQKSDEDCDLGSVAPRPENGGTRPREGKGRTNRPLNDYQLRPRSWRKNVSPNRNLAQGWSGLASTPRTYERGSELGEISLE